MNMKKRTLLSLLLIGMMLALAACSGSNQPTAQAASSAGETDPANMPVETKLAIGTLKLEGTELAVSAEEARELLPLWKAVKSLSTSDTISSDEIQALYQQIQETMSAEQTQAIEKMKLTTDDLNTLMKDLGIEARGGINGPQDLSETERATRVAQFQARNQAGGGDGGPGGGPAGGPGGEPGMMMPPDGGAGFQGGGFQQTPGAGGMTTRRSPGMNSLFIDPLIQLLEERANS